MLCKVTAPAHLLGSSKKATPSEGMVENRREKLNYSCTKKKSWRDGHRTTESNENIHQYFTASRAALQCGAQASNTLRANISSV